jgi:hypothetical protein
MNKDNILSCKLEKSKKDQKIIISYWIPETNRNRMEEITEIPHPDFITALLNLSRYIASVHYVNEEKLSLCNATGFKFTNQSKLIITGKLATESGSIIGITTPGIDLSEDIYGFEDDLQKDIDILLLETLYLLTGKKVGARQLTIDDLPANGLANVLSGEPEDKGPDNNQNSMPSEEPNEFEEMIDHSEGDELQANIPEKKKRGRKVHKDEVTEPSVIDHSGDESKENPTPPDEEFKLPG